MISLYNYELHEYCEFSTNKFCNFVANEYE